MNGDGTSVNPHLDVDLERGDRSSTGGDGGVVPAWELGDRAGLDAAQTDSDADEIASDTDQSASRAEETASAENQIQSSRDQSLSDRDQAATDREDVKGASKAVLAEHQVAREERAAVSRERHATACERDRTASEHEETAEARDVVAARRDRRARDRDARAVALERAIASFDASMAKKFEHLRMQAAADRAGAARDRARAAKDRAEAARERSRLEAELLTAHLDDLTGAYRRGMGRLALTQEIERARRQDGRLVLAFVDVNDLKGINDRQGHSAGDETLRTVVKAIRANLRSFDPILRYGGDEFIAGMGGMNLEDAQKRFDLIRGWLKEQAGVSVSVGLAALQTGETADELTARADRALYGEKNGSRRTEPLGG